MALSDQNRAFMALVSRSVGADGFARVGKMLMKVVREEVTANPELYEFEELADGTGRLRFTDAGSTVRKYV